MFKLEKTMWAVTEFWPLSVFERDGVNPEWAGFPLPQLWHKLFVLYLYTVDTITYSIFFFT